VNYTFDEYAQAEMIEAAEWYEMQSPGLGHVFLAAVRVAVNEVADNPDCGTEYEAVQVRGVCVEWFTAFRISCCMRLLSIRSSFGWWRTRAANRVIG
jgi:hypothetical protein